MGTLEGVQDLKQAVTYRDSFRCVLLVRSLARPNIAVCHGVQA